MGEVLQFPNGAALAAPLPKPQRVTNRPKAQASAVVVPIRPGQRSARKPREADEKVAMIHRLSKTYREIAAELAHEPANKDYLFALHMAGMSEDLPINNLRCILSTLDEQRDFELRCAEFELAHARHSLGRAGAERVHILEGEPWWLSPTQKAMVAENNILFEEYRRATMDMAFSPARTWPHYARKVRMIGRCWLTAEGDWYDRIRTAVEVDRVWLEANRPKKRRAAK